MGLTRNVMVCALIGASSLVAVGCGSTFTEGTAPPETSDGATSTPALQSEPVGGSFTDTDPQGNLLDITLTAIINPATSTTGTVFLTAGDILIATKFTLVGKTGTSTGDVDFDAVTVIGSDGQTYTPDVTDDIVGCTNFDNGTYNVTAGQTSVGCVAFQIPKAVKPAQVQWSDLFSDSAPATWNVG